MASNDITDIDDRQVQAMQHLPTVHLTEDECLIYFVTPSHSNDGSRYLSMVDIHATLKCRGEIVIFKDIHGQFPVEIKE
jgi:hypothetical protein